MSLIQIKQGWHRRRMKETGDEFEAKKLGEAFYLIRLLNGLEQRHLAKVVEELSEEVKNS